MFSQVSLPITEFLKPFESESNQFQEIGNGQFSKIISLETNPNQASDANESSKNQKEVFKFLSPWEDYSLTSKFTISRFFREISALVNMKHPLICKINYWNLFIDQQIALQGDPNPIVNEGFQPFFSMPHYENELGKYINTLPKDTTNVILIAYGLLRAYRHIHSFGFLMRDIQPRNIMLIPKEYHGKTYLIPIIIDFGGCKFDNNSEVQSIQTGALKYLPIDCRRKKRNEQHKFYDYYACGIVIAKIMYPNIQSQLDDWDPQKPTPTILRSGFLDDPFYPLFTHLTRNRTNYDFHLACLEMESLVKKFKNSQKIVNTPKPKWYETEKFDFEAFKEFKDEIDQYEKKEYVYQDLKDEREEVEMAIGNETNIYRIERILLDKAKRHNHDACLRVALDYMNGHILPKNIVKCIHYLYLSMKHHRDPIAWNFLQDMSFISTQENAKGLFYRGAFKEAGVPTDLDWTNIESFVTDSESLSFVENRSNPISDYQKSFEIDKSSMVLGRMAVLMHQSCLKEQNLSEDDKNKISKIMNCAVELNDVYAMSYYGHFLISTREKSNVEKGIQIFWKLLKNNYINAAGEIARAYEILGENDKALAYYRIAFQEYGDDDAKTKYLELKQNHKPKTISND